MVRSPQGQQSALATRVGPTGHVPGLVNLSPALFDGRAEGACTVLESAACLLPRT